MSRLFILLLGVCVLAAPAMAGEPAAAQLKLKSGITLHYATQGRADGEPIVLLHGIGDSWRSFELVLPHIPERYRVFAISMRGHGWSDGPASGYLLRDYAADISAFLEQLNLRNVTLVGHSLGSFVAQAAAVEDRGRLARLVLIGSGPGGVSSSTVRAEVQQLFRGVRAPVDPAFARDFQASTVTAPIPAAFMERMYEQIVRAAPQMWAATAEGIYSPDLARGLTRVKVPTLLIWGDQDAMLARGEQDGLLTRLPNARLVVFEGNGHTPHWEDPARVAKELVAFVSPD
jgi:pimeloyl-ACP methyl ester carboxylesterase